MITPTAPTLACYATLNDEIALWHGEVDKYSPAAHPDRVLKTRRDFLAADPFKVARAMLMLEGYTDDEVKGAIDVMRDFTA